MEKSINNSTITYDGREFSVNKKLHEDRSVTYLFHNEDGDAQMIIYMIAPGIKVVFHDVHAERTYLGTAKKGNVIEIHYCHEGRMERNHGDDYFYLMPGDLAIDIVNRESREFVLPTQHYHGITISINMDFAPKCFSCFLKDVNVQPVSIAQRLCSDRGCFVMHSEDYIEHLFHELYHCNIPTENKKGYYKVKVLELLLILSGINPEENKIKIYALSQSQVDLAKQTAAYIEKCGQNRITVGMLSEQFHVSATHLRNAFKGVYGVTIFSYIRIQKMNKAAKLLTDTRQSVLEIANICGYDNASKFASAFREVMGQTPVEYRKSNRISQLEF